MGFGGHLILGFVALFAIAGLQIQPAAAWHRHLWRGRPINGTLGEPSRTEDCHSASGQRITCSPLPADEWFDQLLDHFDATNARVWKQRFYTNREFYKPGGPVFLMIGGEGEATAKWMVQGAWAHYAREHNALMFQLEHRFYGQSHPTEDLSTANLVHLSSEQALADLANFIAQMNERHGLPIGTTKWIAFGGSYPGSLAAWLRQKYPHLVHGAVSSSGPLLAKADFREYYEVVRASLAAYQPACVDAVGKSIEQVEIMMRHMIGQRGLTQQFSLCDPLEKSINNPRDIANFLENLASLFAGVVQYNKDYSPHARTTIDQVCDIMLNQTIGPQVTRLAAVNRLLLQQQNQTCLDYGYDKMIAEMRNTSWLAETAEGGRQWTYQTCTEFGFYQTSDNETLLFGDRFPVDFFYNQCVDIFGATFDRLRQERDIFRTNTNYGELHARTTNVIYVHGSIDPWHALGLTQSSNADMPTVYIEGTAHCANMYEPQPDDFAQLKAAREKIRAFIGGLLAD